MSETAPSIRVYFMSGTGNSYWSARRFAKMAEGDENTGLVTPTSDITRSELKGIAHNGLLAFSYPTHGFSMPWHMLKFIVKFPRGKARTVLINNRAGMKMGKIFTPGLSGLAILFPMIILLLKGYRVSGVVPLDTPSNWISIHPGIKKRVVDSIFDRRERDLSDMWAKIDNNKTYFPAKFFILLPLDIFLIPISFAYLLFGRFMLARTYLSDTNCDGCGICSDRCPVSAIKMVEGRPWWTYKCESCMRCANVCPKKSVNSSIPLMVIYSLVLSRLNSVRGLLEPLYDIVTRVDGIAGEAILYGVYFIITVVATWVMYFILFYLNRIGLISKLIAYTTPMKYWRRYIAPGFRGFYVKSDSTNRSQTPSGKT